MKVLALSGSIRHESSNVALLTALRARATQTKQWDIFEIKSLPFFDPQLQFQDIPTAVNDLRQLARAADFLVIATPEYAHGIPGILKNALEWLVCEETLQKKVVVFIASASGGEFVKEYLLETLKTMDMIASSAMTCVVRSARIGISASAEVTDAELDLQLTNFLQLHGLR